jgi:hypothetical protein
VSLSWHPKTFTIVIGQHAPHETIEVYGLVDNLGLFGMHFVDKLHSYISITELRSGCRVHPEPGFPDLALAATFAESIAHIDFSHPKKMPEKDRQFIFETYNRLIMAGKLRDPVRSLI